MTRRRARPPPDRGRARAARWLSLTALLLGTASSSAARASSGSGRAVIPSGQEEFFADVLGRGADLAGGCRWAGARIERTFVSARYTCPDGTSPVIELHHPDDRPASSSTTRKFAVVAGDTSAEASALLQEIAERVGQQEAGWQWEWATEPADSGDDVAQAEEPRGFGWWPGLRRGLGFTLVLVTAAAGLLWASRRRPSAPERDRGEARENDAPVRPAPLATPGGRVVLPVSALVLSLALLVFMLARFRFAFDDFFLLERAATSFQPDDSLRLALGGLFRLGVRLGGTAWPFVLANTLALAALLGLAWRCARRIGLCGWTALLSTALVALAPGLYELVRWGVGFQQLASMAIVLGVMDVASGFARACSEDDRRRAAALALAGAALGATGVFVKYPTMAMVPAAAALWSACVARPRCSWRQAATLGGVILLGAAIPFALAHLPGRSGELGKVGAGRVAANVLALGDLLSRPLSCALLAMAAMWVAGRLRPAARGAVREETAPPAGLDRAQTLGLGAVAAALGVPYLFNGHYFAGYYAILPWAALSPLVASRLSRAAFRAPRWSAGAAALFLLPVTELRLHTQASVFNDVGRRLGEVVEATRDLAPARRIALMVSCDDDASLEAAHQELDALLVATEGGAGVRWATGWNGVNVERIADPGDLEAVGEEGVVLLYCPGTPIRRHDRPAGPRPEAMP